MRSESCLIRPAVSLLNHQSAAVCIFLLRAGNHWIYDFVDWGVTWHMSIFQMIGTPWKKQHYSGRGWGLTLCLIAGSASTSFWRPSCLFPTYTNRHSSVLYSQCKDAHVAHTHTSHREASNPPVCMLTHVYLKKDADHSQPVVLHHGLLKQAVLVRVPVNQVELGTHTIHKTIHHEPMSCVGVFERL